MRILLYTLALAVLPMLVQANHIERDLEGYWDNHQTHTTIKVRAKRYGFKIKGIYGNNRWTKFRKNYLGQYRDSRGNKLIIRHRNRIEFVNRHNGLVTPFWRHRRYGSHYRSDYRKNHRLEHDGYYRDRERHYDYSDNQGGYYRGEDRKSSRGSRGDARQRNTTQYAPIRIDVEKLSAMEGTWQSEDADGKKVIIVSTRDGIKVKDNTTNKWYRYILSSDNTSLIDDIGNQYQIDDTSLYWISGSNKRVITLRKISATTF